MKHMIFAALLAVGGATAAVAADVIIVVGFDSALSQKFEVKREIVDQVQQAFGHDAVFESAEALKPAVENKIVPGNKMPADVKVSPVPEALGELPHTVADSHWARVGNHLVELTSEDRIATVVYEALP